MKKKYSLLIAILTCFLVYVVLSWILPTGSIASNSVEVEDAVPVGLFGLLYYPAYTVVNFFQYGLLVLTIGAFYGVLSKTGVYTKLIDNIVRKVKNKKKLFLILTIIVLSLLSSIIGVQYALFILVPFLMGILLSLGYDKFTSVASTIGSILIGEMASTFGFENAGVASLVFSIDALDGIWFRFLLLALVLFIFVMFITSRAKEVKNTEVLFVDNSNKSKKKTLPLIIVSVLTLLVAFVSMYGWNYVLGVSVFEDFYEKISGIDLLNKILGLTNPFGYWSINELVVVLLLASLVIGWIYNLKLVDICDGMVSGAKRLAKTACYAVLANILLILTVSTSSNMLIWITSKFVGISDSFNVLSVTLSSFAGSLLCNYYYYMIYMLSSVFTTVYSAANEYHVIVLLTQAIYGIVMLLVPTSVLLVSGLTMADISYKEWLKYIWKFLVEVLIIVLVVAVIVTLIVL